MIKNFLPPKRFGFVILVRNGRIELPPDAWEAPVLPLN